MKEETNQQRWSRKKKEEPDEEATPLLFSQIEGKFVVVAKMVINHLIVSKKIKSPKLSGQSKRHRWCSKEKQKTVNIKCKLIVKVTTK
eukprot:11472888-Ditylum_brightwellii.AAC.1